MILYEEPRLKINKPVVVDLGCNIGYESKKLYDICAPSLLISVDPFEENIAKTKELIKVNNWLTDCCAVAEDNGEKEISYCNSPHTNNMPCGGIIKRYSSDILNRRTIKTKTLQRIHYAPDILKIDIESYEWVIWDQLINTNSIKIMFLELHVNDIINQQEMNSKIDLLETVYNVRWFEYAQSQKLEHDICTEKDRSVFAIDKPGSVCHILCERKQ